MHIFHSLNLYPNYFISKCESTDTSDYEYYDNYEGPYDDYDYDQDYAEDYGLETGEKFIILRISSVQLFGFYY